MEPPKSCRVCEEEQRNKTRTPISNFINFVAEIYYGGIHRGAPERAVMDVSSIRRFPEKNEISSFRIFFSFITLCTHCLLPSGQPSSERGGSLTDPLKRTTQFEGKHVTKRKTPFRFQKHLCSLNNYVVYELILTMFSLATKGRPLKMK